MAGTELYLWLPKYLVLTGRQTGFKLSSILTEILWTNSSALEEFGFLICEIGLIMFSTSVPETVKMMWANLLGTVAT